MVNKIACFLTCGYTEAGAMQFFLKKINNEYEYKQYLPNKTIKKKGDAKTIGSSISGLTGEALLEKVYSIISRHKEEIGQCKAIIIEDDLDGKFHECRESQIEEYKKAIIDKIYDKLEKEIPVFILYASPEVESWFIADWKNGFEYLYCDSGVVNDVERNAKLFFSHHLKKYIDEEILKEYAENIEEYGYFNGEYIKLSDQLIDAIQTGVKDYIQAMPKANDVYIKQIVESRNLYYSKKLHGDRMLRNISPDIIAGKCRKYFGNAYSGIQSVGS
ncbi:MAG: hypothetical protein KH452_09020 [Clostridiales bacterium]|nr:hypothetical protein [Clostridiales bacterium]